MMCAQADMNAYQFGQNGRQILLEDTARIFALSYVLLLTIMSLTSPSYNKIYFMCETIDTYIQVSFISSSLNIPPLSLSLSRSLFSIH